MNRSQLSKQLFLLRNKLSSTGLFTVAIPLLLIILLHGPLESLVSDYPIKHILSKIESSYLIDAISIIIALYLLMLFLTQITSYTPSLKFTFIAVMSGIIYAYYRFFSGIWIFTPALLLPAYRYTDIILLFSGSNLFTYVIYRLTYRKTELDHNGLLNDSSLGHDGKDEIGYEKYVAIISRRIMQSGGEQAIAIGINGRWGSGKTSFIDMMKRKLQNEDILSVSINPWASAAPGMVIRDFFGTIEQAIKPYHATISRSLSAYAARLIDSSDTDQTKYLGLVLNSLSAAPSNDNLYEDINQALKETGKRLLVFIDDLDRLDKNEIIEVIRLVRNTANFSNTIFVVAYDRSYVINALMGHNSFGHERFLEKIFQLEINLPHFEWYRLQLKLVKELEKVLPEKFKGIAAEYLGEKTSYDNTYLVNWLETPRDVSRLVNGLSVNLMEIIGEVYFPDFIRLELLRLKYPAVYELLYKKTADFFTAESSGDGNHRYKLLPKNTKTNNSNNTTGFQLHEYLLNNTKNLAIDHQDTEKVIKLLSEIFGNSNFLDSAFHSPLSARNPSRFSLYFAYSMLDGKLSEVEFTEARNSGLEALKEKIDQWVAQDLIAEVEKRFIREKEFDSRTDFENMIQAICYFARKEINGNGLGYDAKDFINKTDNFDDRASNRLYEGDKSAYQEFIRSVFTSARAPYAFEVNTIRKIAQHLDDDRYALKKTEMSLIVAGYLQEYAKTRSNIDRVVWMLYDASRYTEYTRQDNEYSSSQVIIPDAVKTTMISLIDQDLPDFLCMCIERYPHGNQKKPLYMPNGNGDSLFGSQEAFLAYLNAKDCAIHPEVEEYKQFLNRFNDEHEQKYIPFNFNYIKSSAPEN